MQIETKRLWIRDYLGTDWAAVHEYASLEKILIYEAWGPNAEADTIQFVEDCMAAQKSDPRITFDLAIQLKDPGKLVGGCRFWYTNDELTAGDIGYIINPRYWGNGYAMEATLALMDFFTLSGKITHFGATCDALNTASQRVLAKCGFTLDRRLENDVHIKGRWRDTLVYNKRV